MTPEVFLRIAVAPALQLLPPAMDRLEARALLLAIALQETALTARRQREGGPARSYLQFERVCLKGVLTHPKTQAHARALCVALDVLPNIYAVSRAIEFQDVLATGLGRLLLWTDPRLLPTALDDARGWHIYLATWNPGRPRPETWLPNFAHAWRVVRTESGYVV